jgi:PPP family 3-phenylpropionic acid transporter
VPKTSLISSPSRRPVLRAAIVYALLFGAVGAYMPYVPIYLSSTGLDLGTVGALLALFAAVGLVAAPSWGALADGIGDVRGPVLAAALLSGGAIVLLGLATSPVALAVATALLAAAFAGVIPMVDSQTVRLVGDRDRFGQARGPGSAAFVVMTFVSGAVIGLTGPRGMFLVFGPLVVLTGVAAWLLLRQPDPSAAERALRGRSGSAARALASLSPATIVRVLRAPRLSLFFVGSIVVWTAQATLLGFLSLRLLDIHADATTIAAAWSVGAVVEVPLMAAFPRLARRFGVERLIVAGALAFVFRAAVIALVAEPVLIVAASSFGGIGFAFFYVGTVIWVSGAVRPEAQATAQGIFTGTANNVGVIVGSIVGGAIGAALGLPALFGLAAAGYGVGAALVWLGIRRRRSPAARPDITSA